MSEATVLPEWRGILHEGFGCPEPDEKDECGCWVCECGLLHPCGGHPDGEAALAALDHKKET